MLFAVTILSQRKLIMSFQRLKVRGLQNTAQRKTTSVRSDNALELLQSEAEKVRKWQIKVDMNIKEKDKEVKVLKETVDSLQKAILECKIGKENAERRLDDEMKTRESTNKRLESTRQMCMLIKDEFRRIEDTLAVYNQMSEALHDEDSGNMMKIQKLLDDFVSMEEFVAEESESWKRNYEKLRAEKDEMSVFLTNANRDVAAKSVRLCELEEKILLMHGRVKELKAAKSELNDSIEALLATYGKLQRDRDSTVSELENQIKMANEIVEEKNQLLSSITEQYEYSKQTWRSSEEDFNAAMRDVNTEKDVLIGRLDEADMEKRKLKEALDIAASEINNLNESVSSLKGLLSLAKNKETNLTTAVENLQSDLDVALADKETLKKDMKGSLSEKTEECHKLEKKVVVLEHEIKSAQTDVDQYLTQINEKSAILDKRDGEIETLKGENDRITKEIKEIREESAVKSKLLKTDCTKAKQSCAAETKKLKKVSDTCTRLEKKVQDLEKSLEKAKEANTNSDETFRKQLQEKDEELKHMNKELADANAQVKELVDGQKALESKTDNRNREHGKETSDLQNKVLQLNEVNVKQKDELIFLRHHLKDTEKLLCDEGNKILKKNDELISLKKTISDLEYSLGKKSKQIKELDKEVTQKEKQIKSLEAGAKKKTELKECSFSPGAVGQWRRHMEAKRMKMEAEDTRSKKGELPAPAPRPNVGNNSIYGTAADELLSEVSFGSMQLDTDIVARKYMLASSTPKVNSKNQAKLHKTNKGQRKATRKAQPRKTKVVKSEPKVWFNNDDVYGFHE